MEDPFCAVLVFNKKDQNKNKFNTDRLTNFFHDYKIRQDSEQSSVNRRRLLQHAISNTDLKKTTAYARKRTDFLLIFQ